MLSVFSKKFILYLLLIVSTLIGSSLACNLPQRGIRSVATEIPVSTASVQELENTLEQAAKTFEETGKIEVKISETQITSYVATQIQTESESPFSNPQIKLRDGQIQVEGDVEQSGFNFRLKANIAVKTDQQGGISHEIVSASLGSLPLPKNILDQVSVQIEQALENYLADQIGQIFIEEITIENGEMILRGRSR